jgi:phosphoribosylglycinamide formyltransferase 1
MSIPNVILFCSGNGSNAKAIIQYAQQNKTYNVVAIFCNNKNAGIIEWANTHAIALELFTKAEFQDQTFLNRILSYNANVIALAGFLLQVPSYLIQAFPENILNIHPALLPKYGGKGMYGHFVHEAVKANNEKQSGITIHIVNEKYDDGRILKQATVDLAVNDTAEDIAKKVLQLEHLWFAKTIEQHILNA